MTILEVVLAGVVAYIVLLLVLELERSAASIRAKSHGQLDKDV